MAFLKINNVAIRGISACVPPEIQENSNLPFYSTPEEADQVCAATGIKRRHIVTDGITVSDLCRKAAEQLIADLGWEKQSIDLIAVATQNPDYLNQPTSFVVHEQMELPESTICLDFFHGCPAWAVSLSSVSSMMQTGAIKRAILMDGDTISRYIDAANREEKPLFGDAGTATALEYQEGAAPICFNIGTKSDDGKALIKTSGGNRHPYTLESLKTELDRREGLISEGAEDKMDAMDVFSFAITKVPKALKRLCAEYEINMEDTDKLVLHQANKMIIETIAKRLKMPMERVPMSLENYGNTTSASIPMTIVASCREDYQNSHQRTLACGFGTGLAWGALYVETENIVIPEVHIY